MIFLSIACIIAALCLPAIPQPLAYHAFADHRESYGIPYFLNVISNIGFLLVGVIGLTIVMNGRAYFEYRSERWPYILFFAGVLLTAIGSSYYHLAPNNERLFWDRLPMTIAFMALVSSQIVERIDRRAGLVLLVPMLLLGASSVIYWRATERMGVGNVLPYGMLQAYAVFTLLLLTVFSPSRYTRSKDFYWVFAWYIASKVLEKFDARIWSIGHLVSGHTLKHLAATMAGVVVCYMLIHRKGKVM
jgi:hypothetical protein